MIGIIHWTNLLHFKIEKEEYVIFQDEKVHKYVLWMSVFLIQIHPVTKDEFEFDNIYYFGKLRSYYKRLIDSSK